MSKGPVGAEARLTDTAVCIATIIDSCLASCCRRSLGRARRLGRHWSIGAQRSDLLECVDAGKGISGVDAQRGA